MDRSKMFTCQKCDADMEVPDTYNMSSIVCHRCGQTYTLQWVERESAYEMTPVEPVEEETRNTAEAEEDEPFRVLNEPAATRKDDIDRFD